MNNWSCNKISIFSDKALVNRHSIQGKKKSKLFSFFIVSEVQHLIIKYGELNNVKSDKKSNYGSIAQSSNTGTIDAGAFGASPEPPPTVAIQHNQHLSNVGNIQRSMTDPLVPQKSPSRFRGLYNAAIHSPYLRTISPHITTKSSQGEQAL